MDYTKMFALITTLETIRLFWRNWSMYHLNAKPFFYNEPLEDMIKPSSFAIEENEDLVYKLHKALNGLKPNKKIDSFQLYFF